MLGHPVRIRILELLADGPRPVRDLLAAIEIEPSNLSQQLGVLRRSGIVTATRDGNTVVYAMAGGDVAELMRAARRILTELLAGQNELLAELREAERTDEAARACERTDEAARACKRTDDHSSRANEIRQAPARWVVTGRACRERSW